MGERKMLQKERKSPSQKKSKKAMVPSPTFSWRDWKDETGLGGTAKSWISSSPSACHVHQTWPQLVVVNFPESKRNSREIENFPVYMVAESFAITGVSSPAFAFYKWEHCRSLWKTRDCRVTEPFSGGGDENHRYLEFTNLIGFQGKKYAISRQGCLALFEEEGNSGIFEITALGRHRVVPNCKVSKHFREYMLECNGEIYLVFLLSRASINVVNGVEVHRLDRSRLSWEKVDRLKGDAMFFVEDDGCLGISASELGCRKGVIAFTSLMVEPMVLGFVCDMETSCISPTSGPEVDL